MTARITVIGFTVDLKWVSLLTLALQNAFLSVIMHYSRVTASPTKTYSASSAVLMNELLKGSISLLIALKRVDNEMTVDERHARSPMSRVAGAKGLGLVEDHSGVPSITIPDSHHSRFAAMTTTTRTTTTSFPVRAQTFLAAYVKRSRWQRLGSDIFSRDCWKLSIPAILYVIQNNLQYVAASNLDVATFQVTYQMKILTTAFFSVLLLGKRLSTAKWMSLLLLAIGVGIVQIQSTGQTVPSGIPSTAALVKDYVEHSEHKALRSDIPILPPADLHVNHHQHAEMNPFKGFMAVTAACMTSGLAGVYFEMVLKGSKADLWTRNIQLSFFSLIPALLPVLVNGSSGAGTGLFGTLIEPFRDFSLWAWATVLTQVVGGLITALVIKYSDNILKGFATSLSIILSFLASVGLFNYPITPAFVIGSMVVLCATWMYNQPEQKKANAMAVGGPTPSRMDVAVSGSPIRQDAPIIGETPKPSRTPSVASLIGLANSITRSSTPTAQHGDHLQPSSMPYGSNNSNSNSNRGTPTGYYTPVMSSYPSSASLASSTSSPILQQDFSHNGGQHAFTLPSRYGQGQHTPPSSTYRPSPIHVNTVNNSHAGVHYSQSPVFEHEESIPTSPYTATTSYSSGPRVMRDSPVRERKGSMARGQRPVMDIHSYDKMR
ncbi:hypothetical protein QFC22_002072 [Naganishia vaughanmartiniae]|uniref:Uncharacterized protein n=1 Tax=Naganishia vaughanmartiniae TaxID=1424756 RepID=A0ACC2XDJ5_9TREE|nr:hypothetical protein QFC22_002072 [Naganishia vaughanmartiniae]